MGLLTLKVSCELKHLAILKPTLHEDGKGFWLSTGIQGGWGALDGVQNGHPM